MAPSNMSLCGLHTQKTEKGRGAKDQRYGVPGLRPSPSPLVVITAVARLWPVL